MRASTMSERNITDIGKQKVIRQKPFETAEKLRQGFAEAVKVAVSDHRTAGRPVHEVVVKPRSPR
jgi:hypothetical protein